MLHGKTSHFLPQIQLLDLLPATTQKYLKTTQKSRDYLVHVFSILSTNYTQKIPCSLAALMLY